MKIKNSLRGVLEHILLARTGHSEFPEINDEVGKKSLWRFSGGSRSKAIEIVKKIAAHHKLSFEWDDFEFDSVTAEIMGGGCEVEWVSD